MRFGKGEGVSEVTAACLAVAGPPGASSDGMLCGGPTALVTDEPNGDLS